MEKRSHAAQIWGLLSAMFAALVALLFGTAPPGGFPDPRQPNSPEIIRSTSLALNLIRKIAMLRVLISSHPSPSPPSLKPAVLRVQEVRQHPLAHSGATLGREQEEALDLPLLRHPQARGDDRRPLRLPLPRGRDVRHEHAHRPRRKLRGGGVSLTHNALGSWGESA